MPSRPGGGCRSPDLEALRIGARPRDVPQDEEITLDFTRELLASHGVSESTYLRAIAALGEKGVVELSTLIGYFVMVSWLMNVSRTPAQAGSSANP